MPKKKTATKKTKTTHSPAPAPAATAPAPSTSSKDAPLALRLAVLEDVVRRSAQETRAFQTKLETFAATQIEVLRRVADVEKKRASA